MADSMRKYVYREALDGGLTCHSTGCTLIYVQTGILISLHTLNMVHREGRDHLCRSLARLCRVSFLALYISPLAGYLVLSK